ncbi:hypothetical protein ACTGUP_10155, partial [Streptococcus suis]
MSLAGAGVVAGAAWPAGVADWSAGGGVIVWSGVPAVAVCVVGELVPVWLDVWARTGAATKA